MFAVRLWAVLVGIAAIADVSLGYELGLHSGALWTDNGLQQEQQYVPRDQMLFEPVEVNFQDHWQWDNTELHFAASYLGQFVVTEASVTQSLADHFRLHLGRSAVLQVVLAAYQQNLEILHQSSDSLTNRNPRGSELSRNGKGVALAWYHLTTASRSLTVEPYLGVRWEGGEFEASQQKSAFFKNQGTVLLGLRLLTIPAADNF